MAAATAIVSIISFLLTVASISAADPDMLQDLCVADYTSGVHINGYSCKKGVVGSSDFFFDGLAKHGLINNSLGSVVTPANVEQIPGLNTLGISFNRIDFAPKGINPPHIHPRATEIVFVLEGQLDVGFITTSRILISRTIKTGEIFVFPKALIHFSWNSGKSKTSVVSAFDSQFPGTQPIAASLFGSTPTMPDQVLAAVFQVNVNEVKKIKSKFMPK